MGGGSIYSTLDDLLLWDRALNSNRFLHASAAREGDRLVVQIPPGQTVFEIVPESTTQFFWKGREYYLTFVKDDNEKVTHVVIRIEGETGRWKKTR